MLWTGKCNGVMIGSWFGPIGMVVGGLVGHFYDQHEQDTLKRQEFENCLAVLAIGVSAAMANGSIHPNERKRLQSIGHLLFPEYPAAQIDYYINQIIAHPASLVQCAQVFAHVPEEYKAALICEILSILYADSVLEDSERRWVNQLIAFSGSDPQIWNQASLYFDHGGSQTLDRAECLSLLRLSPEATAEDIKTAYRRSALEFHPDKLSNVSEELRKLAEDRFKAVSSAYEALTKSQGTGGSLTGLMIANTADSRQRAETLRGGEIVICPLCLQRNRLPEIAKIIRARCGICYALLAFPETF